ncbi:MAG: hypothetical protein ACM3QZ_07080 [Solirubrobacterales bacterium]
MEVNIDLDLLKQELALNNLSIAINLDSYPKDIVLDLLSIETIVNNTYQLVRQQVMETDSRKQVDRILSVEDYLTIVVKDYLIDLRNHQLSLEADTEFYLAVVFLTAYLSKLSSNYFNFYTIIKENIPSLEAYFRDTRSFVASSDLRGLLYTTAKKYLNLALYDRHFRYKSPHYLYAPPKVGKEWIQQYRKENEPVCFWFYETSHGTGLFMVLYGMKCRYRQCAGCSLHELGAETRLPSQEAIYRQIDSILEQSISHGERNLITEVILSNNGNMLDDVTMPTLSLLYIVDQCIVKLPALKKITLESRLEYIDEARLRILKETIQASRDGIEIELAVGLEIFDEYYRNHFYKKGIRLETFEERIALFPKYGLSVRVYMMFKACPGMRVEEAIEDINKASRYFAEVARNRGMNITLHISPTFVAKGSLLEDLYGQGKYHPPGLQDIERLLQNLAVYDELTYYISLNDEGLSSCTLDGDFYEYVRIKNAIERFNIYRKTD